MKNSMLIAAGLISMVGAENGILLYAADDEAGQIVVRRRVDAGHLGRLAPDQ